MKTHIVRCLEVIMAFALAIFTASSAVQGQSATQLSPHFKRTSAASLTELTRTPIASGAASRSRNSTQLVCNISAFFSSDLTDRLVKPATKATPTRLEGRGLLTCQNDLGFTTEYGVIANLSVELPVSSGEKLTTNEFTLSGDTPPFVIPREISQLQDTYSVRSVLPSARGPASKPVALFRGRMHNLVIEMNFTSREHDLTNLRVLSLHLRFDESAPDLL
jgi:hypothetical protein